MNALKAATRIYRLRSEWLGDGGEPVPAALATTRANTCLACPNNQHRLWESMARAIVSWTLGIDRIRADLKLATGLETGLHVCAKCDCVLRCKVWVPLTHARAASDLAELPSHCWLITEHNAALASPRA